MSFVSRGMEDIEETEEVRGVNASSCMLSKETIDFGIVGLGVRGFGGAGEKGAYT